MKQKRIETPSLEKLVEDYMKVDSAKADNILDFDDKTKKAFINYCIDNITNEIREELRSEIRKEEKRKLLDEQQNKAIKNANSLIIQTVILGFIVGLLVNQVTDIFEYYIKFDKSINILPTNILAGLLLIFVVVLTGWIIIKDIISIIENIRNNRI